MLPRTLRISLSAETICGMPDMDFAPKGKPRDMTPI